MRKTADRDEDIYPTKQKHSFLYDRKCFSTNLWKEEENGNEKQNFLKKVLSEKNLKYLLLVIFQINAYVRKSILFWYIFFVILNIFIKETRFNPENLGIRDIIDYLWGKVKR